MKTIETWLPVFSGFYNTIWQADDKENQEIEHLNELRSEKDLSPIEWDDCQFDYKTYELGVVRGVAAYLERELKAFVSDITVQGIRSPIEYNFVNDSCDIVVSVSPENEKAIHDYLIANASEFEKYLADTYTSCSGFISSYPNTVEGFMEGAETLYHSHKLGSILQFIALNEGIEEINIYYNVESYIEVLNYGELVPE